jgi:serine/threonine protein phosphatase PrpC
VRLPFARKPTPREAIEPSGKDLPRAFETASRSHVGTVRTLNEDRLLALEEIGLWAIADGMGGHHNGEIAAQMVVDEVARAQPCSAAELRSAVFRANDALRALERDFGQQPSGSTMVALLLGGEHYECLWTGDSEVWRFRDGSVCKLTRDHSLVEEFVQAGLVAEADRRTHPQAHIITQAVGVADVVLVDAEAGEVREGDVFLLCSDGLTGAVSVGELEQLVLDSPLETVADDLLERALRNGASDNVTFILVRPRRQS